MTEGAREATLGFTGSFWFKRFTPTRLAMQAGTYGATIGLFRKGGET
jgi:hypothetical protein